MANPLSSDEILARADKALGLQAMVTVLQFGLWAYRSRKWLCKAMQEVVDLCSYQTNRRNFSHSFAKPLFVKFTYTQQYSDKKHVSIHINSPSHANAAMKNKQKCK